MTKNIFQIQPQYDQKEIWEELASLNGLFYEPLEFFMPPLCIEGPRFEDLKEWYKKSAKVSSLHGAFIDINPASGDPEFKKLSIERCHESCRIAKELGAKNIVFHSSCFPFLRGAYLENWAAACAEFYIGLAGQYDLKICIENSQDIDPDPLCALMQKANSDKICVCLDIGHANFSRAPLEEWFDVLKEHIGYIHLSDNNGKFDDHLPLGEGRVDWKLADALWRGLKKDMPITLEVGGPEGVLRSLAYLKQNGFFGMGE